MTRTAHILVAAATATALLGAAATAAAASDADDALSARRDAARYHRAVVRAYMQADWSAVETLLDHAGRHAKYFNYRQQDDVKYIRGSLEEHRPAWWKHTRSRRPVTFPATIWGKTFKANYIPSRLLGMQAVVGIGRDGKLAIIVTWRPGLVGSDKPIPGTYPEAHGLKEAHLAESICWHELGHNYISQGLPAGQVLTLFREHRMLFSVLQEFYADMTALHHCSPAGRKVGLMVRAKTIWQNNLRDPHVRAAHGVGAFLLARILCEPEKWPSFRLPPRLPDRDAERYAIVYMYTHLDPGYTLAEDRAIRRLVGQFLTRYGASVLRKRGTLPLASGKTFKFIPSEDRKHQPLRDAWVRRRLASIEPGG